MKTIGQNARLVFTLSLLACTLNASLLPAQDPPKQPGNKPPLAMLRLDSEGPVSKIKALAFSPDGNTLYAGGYDKTVYVWEKQNEGKFALKRNKSLRIPIGPGTYGAINAVAVSSEGRYVAVAGNSMASHIAGFSKGGLVRKTSAQSVAQRLELGRIYVFDLHAPNQPKLITLKGHIGPVIKLTFAKTGRDQDPVLVSAGQDYNEATGKDRGAVRVWNLNTPQKPVAENFDEKFDGLIAPLEQKDANGKPRNFLRAVAPVRTGNAANALQVGIAWADHQFRVWDVKANKTTRFTNFFSFACAAVDNQLLLAGSFAQIKPNPPKGYLSIWTPPVNAGVNPKPISPFLRDGQAPIGLAVGSSNQTHTAMVVYLDTTSKTSDIGFFLANAKTLARLPGPNVVFGGRGEKPTFAMSPNAEFLAVAGNVDDSIQVFRVDQLRQNQKDAFQTLQNQGHQFPHVRFFEDDKQSLGLGVSSKQMTPAAPTPQLIFDVAGRTPQTDTSKWKLSQSQPGFTATPVIPDKQVNPGAREVVNIEFDNGQKRTIVLDKNFHMVPSEIALAPKSANHPALVGLIVNSPTFAGSNLSIYNAETGDRIRWFNGHTDFIKSIAFSKDGRLLASASIDRTVRVWWLDNLNTKIVRKFGYMSRLDVRDQNGQAVIKEIDEFDAKDIKDELKEGDIILGVYNQKNTLTKTPKAINFFDQLLDFKPGQPGEKVKIRIQRGNIPMDVTVSVQQGIDERKPLFSMIFDKTGNTWSWIGWTPTGPFDSSGDAIEQQVAWHFNGQTLDDQPLYAEMSKNRDNYFGAGLLKILTETGKVPDVWPPIAPPKNVSLQIYDSWDQDNGQLVILDPKQDAQVRTKNVKAKLCVPDFPASYIESIVWTLDGKPIQALRTPDHSEEFWLDLTNFDWKRKEGFKPYTLEVSLKTTLEQDTLYTRTARIQYDPEAPPPLDSWRSNSLSQRTGLPTAKILVPPSTTARIAPNPRETLVRVELTPASQFLKPLSGTMTIQVNGTTVKEKGNNQNKNLEFPFDGQSKTIEAQVPLLNHKNLIRVRMESTDGKNVEFSPDTAIVWYKRPPIVRDIQVETVGNQPEANITCTIETPSDLQKLEVKFLLNADFVTAKKLSLTQNPQEKNLWKMTATGVPIREGENLLKIVARNDEYRVLAAYPQLIKFERIPDTPPPPRVLFTNVNDQSPIQGYWKGEDFPVEFQVIARGKLKQVYVHYNEETLPSPEIPTVVDGKFFNFKLPLRLRHLRNPLSIVALDEHGGYSSASTTLIAVEPPLTLLVDQLDIPDTGEIIHSVPNTEREIQFATVPPQAKVVLRGHIVGSNAAKGISAPWVKCSVNGFLQRTQAIKDPNKPNEWKFAFPLKLNKAKKNHLLLELPDALESQFSQTRGTVDCLVPDTRQELHILVIGTDPNNPRGIDPVLLKKKVEKAFDVRNGKNRAFDRVEIYSDEYLTNSVNFGRITGRLNRIQALLPGKQEGAHHVVVFYYQGQEVLNRNREVVLKTAESENAQTAMTSTALIKHLNKMHGAHAIFLEVAHNSAYKYPAWNGGHSLGILRTTHQDVIPANKTNPFPMLSALELAMPKIKTLNQLPNEVQLTMGNQFKKSKVQTTIPNNVEDLVIGNR